MPTSFNDFVRLPADGGGKRLHSNLTVVIAYNGAAGNTFAVGDVVVGYASNFTGEVTYTNVIDTNTGTILVRPSFDDSILSPQASEELRVNGSLIAYAVDQGVQLYNQNLIIAGANNPLNGQHVDNKGAAYVRFEEGPQQFDALGLSKNVHSTIVGDYSFEYGDDTDEFQLSTSGTGTQIFNSNDSSITLQVGTASGASAYKTTNKYHLFNYGSSQLIELLFCSGDTGKTNVRRRWGYFDTNDGAYFELNGTTFSVVIRSSSTGSVVNTTVTQTNFNTDKVDGSNGALNLSGANIELDKVNYYWIDMHWRRIRFGIYFEGRRIVIHEHILDGSNSLFKKFNLPVRFEIENTGTSASTSEIKIHGANVKIEANIDLKFQKTIKPRAIIGSQVELSGATAGSEYYIGTYKSSLTINSVTNRKISIPISTITYVTGGDAIIRIYKNCTISGASYIDIPGTAVRVDSSGTITAPGPLIAITLASSGPNTAAASEVFSYLGDHLRLNADGTDGNSYTITIEPIAYGTDPVVVISGANWIDVG